VSGNNCTNCPAQNLIPVADFDKEQLKNLSSGIRINAFQADILLIAFSGM
jgi:hypothetical protein